MTEPATPFKVICFGEILWDVFEDQSLPGGAPLNVAYHLAKMNCSAHIVSAVGADTPGALLLDEVFTWGLDTRHIRICKELPTGTVNVRLDAGIPVYTITENVAWDRIGNVEAVASLQTPRAIVFGSLAQRSKANRETLEQLFASAPGALRVFDVNLRPPWNDMDRVRELLSITDLLKVNEEELLALVRDSAPSVDIESSARTLADQYGCDSICVTLGAEGAALLRQGVWTRVAASPVEAVDTVGAGDAFLAALLAGLGRDRREPRDALIRATQLAGYVATQAGATPAYTADNLHINTTDSR